MVSGSARIALTCAGSSRPTGGLVTGLGTNQTRPCQSRARCGLASTSIAWCTVVWTCCCSGGSGRSAAHGPVSTTPGRSSAASRSTHERDRLPQSQPGGGVSRRGPVAAGRAGAAVGTGSAVGRSAVAVGAGCAAVSGSIVSSGSGWTAGSAAGAEVVGAEVVGMMQGGGGGHLHVGEDQVDQRVGAGLGHGQLPGCRPGIGRPGSPSRPASPPTRRWAAAHPTSSTRPHPRGLPAPPAAAYARRGVLVGVVGCRGRVRGSGGRRSGSRGSSPATWANP